MLVKLNSGLEIEVSEDDFNDMRVLELLSDDNPLSFPKLMNMIMEKDQKQKIYDYIAKENNGKIPVDKFASIFNELMEKMGEQCKNIKN